MDKLNFYFHYLVYGEKDKFQNFLDFLKTLNLTDEQYNKLGEFIELYGDIQYENGQFNENQRNQESNGENY